MYDVVVIGGGPGGYAAAIRASQLRGKTALVEADLLGGTCVNRGCIPTKLWLRAAKLLRNLSLAGEFGIKVTGHEIDLSALVQRKTGVAQDIRTSMDALLRNHGVELIRGRGTLKNTREVRVGHKTLEARNIILATGSSLDVPGAPGLAEAVLTTDQALDLSEIPSPLVVWGGGPVEVEMAACLNAFGARVTLAVDSRRILPKEDRETSQRLAQALREQGVDILAGARLDAVEKSGQGFMVALGDRSVETARVLVAGRKPNTEGLGLTEAGIRLNAEGSIQANERTETSVPRIYAIGDLTGGWMLSHAASAMGVVAAENAMGQQRTFPSHLTPRGLWTSPEAAAVGLSEEEAEGRGYKVEVGDFPYSVNGLAMVEGEVGGAVKVVSDASLGQILGVHIVGAGATELIGEAVMALQLECTVEELAHTIRMHPTFSECMMDAARDAASWALYLPRK